ncbi:hypothetical protein B0H16DRAFT_1606126 [Mycena metata]|uniref:DUF6532 domain-containing protein n=1 Tax=Mycena metata TaxID=1033252 RepID=A0AAD7HGY0_9AGAR|nr:hypothetical protein B0H16DRAFT_1606126 [Mycena metata]
MVEYVVRILTKNAFPPVDVQLLWAKECFRSACRAAEAYYGITDRMLKLIAKRGSHIRSQIITACRALFAAHYKFNRTSTSKAAIKANTELAASLCDEARFNYKDIKNQTGYAENTIFNDIRRAVIFKTKKAIGAIFQSHFNPYPLEAVALEFTTVHFCAIEWSTGQFVQTKFEEKEVGEAYITHLNDLRRWEELDKVVIRNIRAKWYKRAIGPLKLAAADGPSGTHIDEKRENLLRQELAGRTGETDSEDENEGAQAEP